MDLSPIDPATSEPELHADAAGWTPARRVRFLELLQVSGDVRACARACGLSAQSAYKLRRRDPLFARSWKAAVLLARDHSEQVMACRALDGIEEPVFYRGEQVGVRRRYDTRLLLAHMARLDRLAEDEAASEDAGRFDELLALIAGERAPEALMGEDPHLPVPEEDHVEAAGEAARRAEDRALPYERSKAGFAARDLKIEAAGEAARALAGAEWRDWFDRACAAVDRAGEAALSPHARTVSTVSTAALAQAVPIANGGIPIYARA
jgi:hypothetical protein